VIFDDVSSERWSFMGVPPTLGAILIL